MKVISCNILFSSMNTEAQPIRYWPNRRNLCFSSIEKYSPDIICLQECHNDQLKDFKAHFGKDYEIVHGNSFPSVQYPENSILYRRDMFRNEGVGAWGLSETPHIPGVKGWGSECVRYVNWVLLKREDGSLLRVVNTHFDHASQLAREMAAKMVNEDAAAWDPELAQILTGDLNCDPYDKTTKILEQGGWKDALEGPQKYETTYHDFRGDKWRPEDEVPYCGCGRMDYVYYRGGLKMNSAEILRDAADEQHFPSDHYFVLADLK